MRLCLHCSECMQSAQLPRRCGRSCPTALAACLPACLPASYNCSVWRELVPQGRTDIGSLRLLLSWEGRVLDVTAAGTCRGWDQELNEAVRAADWVWWWWWCACVRVGGCQCAVREWTGWVGLGWAPLEVPDGMWLPS